MSRTRVAYLIVMTLGITLAIVASVVIFSDSDDISAPVVVGGVTREAIAGSERSLDIDDLSRASSAPLAPASIDAPEPFSQVFAESDVAPLSSLASAPLAEQIDELIERAEQGHPVAACRLAIASMQCKWRQRSAHFAAAVEGSLAQPSTPDDEGLMIDSIAVLDNSSEQKQDFCAGVDAKKLPDTGTALQSAISRLTVRQKVILALLRPDGGVRRLNDLAAMPSGPLSGGETSFVFPQFLSDHAIEFLDAGIQGADPLALEGVILVHAPIAMPWELMDMRIVLPDARRFVAYSLLYQRLYGDALVPRELSERMARSAATLSANDMKNIQDFVDREEKRWLLVSGSRKFDWHEPEKLSSPADGCE